MTNPTEERVIGDEAWRRREAARRRSEWLLQGAAIAVVSAFVWILSENVSENLAARHIRSGFAFLFNSAGFDIGESLVAFQSTDAMWHAFVVGMVNTIRAVQQNFNPSLKFLGVVVNEYDDSASAKSTLQYLVSETNCDIFNSKLSHRAPIAAATTMGIPVDEIRNG